MYKVCVVHIDDRCEEDYSLGPGHLGRHSVSEGLVEVDSKGDHTSHAHRGSATALAKAHE